MEPRSAQDSANQLFAVIGASSEGPLASRTRLVPVKASDHRTAMELAARHHADLTILGARSEQDLIAGLKTLAETRNQAALPAEAFLLTIAERAGTESEAISVHAVAAMNMGFAVASVLQGHADRILLSIETAHGLREQLESLRRFSKSLR